MMMLRQFTQKILTLHTAYMESFLVQDAPPVPVINSLISAAIANHYFNCRLWREEDLARRLDAPNAEIVANKRAIDKFNQSRNDAVERFDEYLLTDCLILNETAPLCSETAGAMMDRLSILALKQHHMGLQVMRQDVSFDQHEEFRQKLERLRMQRVDLGGCLQRLLTDCQQGRARFKVYRQFKMYNDPRYGVAH